MKKIRVLLADDHAILRDGLALLINKEAEMEVVAQAGTASEAVQLAQASEPDVAVIDVSMPEGGGASATEQIRAGCPRVKVLALTRHSDPAYVRLLLRVGATGYVLKKSAADTLISAIRIVAEGGMYVEPSLGITSADGSRRTDFGSKADGLTPREEEVLRAVAWGWSSKEIGVSLSISTKTVESYKAAALDKLRLRSRSEIVRYALARGWLAEDVARD